MATIKPKKKGQKPIHFKSGALTSQAAAKGMTPKAFCATKPGGVAAKRCSFMRNVLVGRSAHGSGEFTEAEAARGYRKL